MRDAAYPTHERPKNDSPLLSSDGSTENMERIELMRESRRMFENIGAVKGAEKVHSRFCSPVMWYAQTGDDDVDLALTTYIAKQMEAENFDMAQAHDLPTSVGSAVIDWGIDGDVFANMAKPRDSRRFRTQWIRAHRVGKKETTFDVSDQFNDLFGLAKKPQRFKERAGIVVDSLGRRRAIKVYPENPDEPFLSKPKAKAIPWNQVCQIVDPLKTDRLREVTRWNGAIPEMVDLEQIWRYLKATIKQQVAAPVIENNKDGRAPRKNVRPSLDGKPAQVDSERPDLKEMIPGMIQYLRPGEKLSDFAMQRPNASFFEAVEYLMRSGSWAIDMPYPFIFEAKKLSGGALRLENNKAGASIGYSRKVVTKTFLDCWVRAKILEGIRIGELPFKVSQLSELAKGRWAWPELPTADEKYLNQTTISLYESGLISGQDVVGPKGTTIEAVQDQKEKETRRIVKKAVALHEEFPIIPVDWFVDRLSKVGPNGSIAYRFPSDVEAENAKNGKNPGDGDGTGGGGETNTRSEGEIAKAIFDTRMANVETAVASVQTEVAKTGQRQEEMMEQLELAF